MTTAFRVLHHLQTDAKPPIWRELLAPFAGVESPRASLHLAVVQEPYLGFILAGRSRSSPGFPCNPCHRIAGFTQET